MRSNKVLSWVLLAYLTGFLYSISFLNLKYLFLKQMIQLCICYWLFVDESYEYVREFVTNDCVRESCKTKYSSYHVYVS